MLTSKLVVLNDEADRSVLALIMDKKFVIDLQRDARLGKGSFNTHRSGREEFCTHLLGHRQGT